MLGTMLSKPWDLELLSFLFYWFSVWIYGLIQFCWWWFFLVGSGEVVGHATQHVRSGFSYQGSNPCLWQWKHSLNHWTFSEPGKPLIQHLDLLPTLSLIPPSFLSIDWKILILPLLNSHQQIFWIQIWTLANFRDSEIWNLQKEGFLKINPDL